MAERRKSEQSSCRSLQSDIRYKELLDSANDAIFLTDTSGNILYANQTMTRNYGYSLKELSRMNIRDIVTPQYARSVATRTRKTVKQGELVFESAYHRKDGSIVDVEVRSRGIEYAGQPAILSVARDVSGYKKAVAELKESEERYRLLAEESEDVIWTMDADMKFTYVSPSIRKLRGIEPEEALRETLADAMTPHSLKNVLQVLESNRTKFENAVDISEQIEIEQYCRDGSTVWVGVNVRALYGKDGKLRGFAGISRNISAKKQAEATLVETERKYRAIIEHSGDFFYMFDRKGNPLYLSPQGLPMLGYSREEFLKLNWTDLLTDNPINQAGLKATADAIRTGIKQPAYLLEFRTKSGGKAIAEVHESPLTDADGKVIGLVGAMHDVTSRKATEDALRNSEEKFRAIAEQSNDVVFTTDSQGIITYLSPATMKVFGFSPEEMIGMNFSQFLALDSIETALTAFAANISGKGHPEIELHMKRKDGSSFIGELRGSLLKLGNQVGTAGVIRDISARKAAEEAINESEKRYRLLAENSEDVIWVINADFIYTYVSPSIKKLRGYDPDEIIGQPLAFTLTGESDKQIMHVWEQIRGRVEQGEHITFRFELNSPCKDGSFVWTEAIVKTLHDESGKFVGILGTSRDLTHRKQAEQARKASEERYRRLLEDADQGILIVHDNKFKFVNSFAARIIGYTIDQIMSMNIFELFYSRDVEKARQNFEKKSTGSNTLQRLELRMVHSSGKIIWVAISALATEWEGKPALMYFVQDISESRSTAEKLKTAEQRFTEFFEHSTNYCLMASPDGEIIDLNKSALNVLGCSSKGEVVGKRLIPTWCPEKSRAKARSIVARWRATGNVENEEITIAVSNGQERDVMISASTVKDDEGNPQHCIIIMTDITEHKRLLEEQARLGRLESVGTLAGGIAHDFNNIMGSALGNISLARAEAPPTGEINSYLLAAEKAILHAKDLTRQLLTFARGGAPVKKLSALREVIMESAGFAVRGSSARCSFNIADGLWPAEVDEGQLGQVINNLVINARQAMPLGGNIGIQAANIVITEDQPLGKSLPLNSGNYVRISVQDEGIGIPAGFIDRIFDPYFTTKHKGSGLGLATCFSIVHNHNGHISVESEPGKGSTFYIYLPASPGAQPAGQQSLQQQNDKFNGSVLVMDDESVLRQTVGAMLKHLGFENVALAENGDEALRLYQEAQQQGQRFDLVILDLTVPGGMGGKATMMKLLKLDPDVKAIVSSGYASEDIMAEYERHGFKGVIAKPYTVNELRDVIRKVLQIN